MWRLSLLFILSLAIGCATPVAEKPDKSAAPISKKEMEKEEGEVISLEARDTRFASYFAHLRRRIERAWDPRVSKYPGTVKLKFVLRADGTLRRVELLKSSGYKILDNAAESAITDTAPFEPLPPALTSKRKYLPITAEFRYERQ